MNLLEFGRHGSRGARAKAGALALMTMAVLVVQFLNQRRKSVLIACLIAHLVIAILIILVVARDKRQT